VTALWQPTGQQNVWVLAVGVSQYDNKGVPPLPYACADAERFRQWFLDLHVKHVPNANVHILLDGQATRNKVYDELDVLRTNAAPEDAVFVYFACHGAPDLAPNGQGVNAKYLVLRDTDPDHLAATGLSLDDLSLRLDSVNAQTQVVVLEACYAGPVGQNFLKKNPVANLVIQPRILEDMGGQKVGIRRTVLSASSGEQMAIGSDDIKGGLFTYRLLDAWGDGSKKMLSTCFDEAKDKVRRDAIHKRSMQEPKRFGDLNVDIEMLNGDD
jgi:uncharacterized caspase-like protein